jgi:hypothetical protein
MHGIDDDAAPHMMACDVVHMSTHRINVLHNTATSYPTVHVPQSSPNNYVTDVPEDDEVEL